MNLYIVESPLQLLCAYEAIHSNKSEPYELLIRQTGRGMNDKHLISCANKLELAYKVFVLHTDNVYIGLLRNFFLWISLYFKKYEKVYLGSIYSSALNLIKSILKTKEFIYLDDGAATLRAQKDILTHKRDKVTWFTFFELESAENQIIIKHNFSNIRKKILKKNKKGVFFIGQPVEAMVDVSKEQYRQIVLGVAKKYSGSGRLFYIPHRVENLENLEGIDNLEIIFLDMPVELHFLLESENLPEKVYSFYSSALITINCMFEGVNCSAIRINDNLNVVYNYMDSVGIPSLVFKGNKGEQE